MNDEQYFEILDKKFKHYFGFIIKRDDKLVKDMSIYADICQIWPCHVANRCIICKNPSYCTIRHHSRIYTCICMDCYRKECNKIEILFQWNHVSRIIAIKMLKTKFKISKDLLVKLDICILNMMVTQ